MAPIQRRRAIIYAAGPALTMLCGSVGLALLWRRQRRQRGERTRVWKYTDWVLLVLAMFWARQPVMALLNGTLAAMGSRADIPDTYDEWLVAGNLGWPPWSLLVVTAILGIAACCTALLWLLPRPWLGCVVLTGLPGTALGLWLWLFVAGPVLMP